MFMLYKAIVEFSRMSKTQVNTRENITLDCPITNENKLVVHQAECVFMYLTGKMGVFPETKVENIHVHTQLMT